MARIDALYPARDGMTISHGRVRNLLKHMHLWAIYLKPRSTVPGEQAKHFPCLVKLNQVTRVDQVWATDITYIPLQKGFLYPVAIVDLYSRHVYSFGEDFVYSSKLPNSLDTEFCLDALDIAVGSGR